MKKVKHEGDLKKRLAAREAAVRNQLVALSRGTRERESLERKQASQSSFSTIAQKIQYAYSEKIIRPLSTFNRSVKTKDPNKIAGLVAAHFFVKYKVPGYLYQCWDQPPVKPIGRVFPGPYRNPVAVVTTMTDAERYAQRQWFITIGTGGSVYKEHAKGILTKNEVHAMLNCPLKFNFREVTLYAIARQHVEDIGILTRIAKTKLSEFTGFDWLVNEPAWREIIHFFCVNNLTLAQMNDLIDYFVHAIQMARVRRQPYSLKGRTLHSLTRQMQDWHWELNRVKRMGNATWEGLPLDDIEMDLQSTPGMKWSFTQIKTSKALANEGTSMHHCVYSYQARCIENRCSIWSVKCLQAKKALGFQRALTIETNGNGDLVQIRGFANRLPKPEEKLAVKAWAKMNQLKILQYGF